MKKRGEKELIIEVLEHSKPYRIPFGEMHICSSFIEKYNGRRYIGPEDNIKFSLEIGRELIKPEIFWFGTKWQDENGKPFKSVKDLVKYSEKKPKGIDCEMKNLIKKTLEQAYEANLLLVVQLAGVLSYAWSMMGFEDFLINLMLDKDAANEVIDLIVQRNTIYASELAEIGVEAVLLTDDIAGNDGIIISPEKYKEMIKPAIKKIIDACGGMYIIYHSDGDVEPVLNDLIEVGIDGFQSIQHGIMDLKKTKERHPDLALFGNVNTAVLHLGTPEEIDALVKECIEIGSPGGNYAVCSDNSIPQFIPVENFKAYISSFWKYTWPYKTF